MMDLSEYGILVVEDNASDIVFIRRAFRQASLGDRIHIVHDGDQAVAYLTGHQEYGDRHQHPLPALILLDLKLPRRSGLEVLGWLRDQPVLKRIPVIVLTSSRQDTDVNLAFELGANSYLVKPVNLSALNQMVKMIDSYWLKLNQFPDLLMA
ncbi:MAG: response regulator [Synechococcales bacterium]|nr:response regulator [Synechococcales bacterium]